MSTRWIGVAMVCAGALLPRPAWSQERAADGVILGTGFDLRVYNWAKQRIREGTAEAGRKESDVAVVAGMWSERKPLYDQAQVNF